MIFPDPAEAKRVGELLDDDQAVAAAELLLGSRHRNHKSVRPLVTRCLQQLMDAAAKLFEERELDPAFRHARLADALRPLSGKNASLLLSIEAAVAERNEQTAHEEALITEARRLADDGRFRTAIERIEPVGDHRAARRFGPEWKAKDQTVERYLREFESFCHAQDDRGAELILDKIRELVPSSDAVIHPLERKLKQLRQENHGRTSPDAPAPDAPRPVRREDRGLILDFGDPGLNTLVLFDNTLVIGAAPTSSTTGTISDIPIPASVLHSQHALIVRHLRHGRMKYWLVPHPSHKAYTHVVRDSRIVRKDDDGSLADGDIIEMGEAPDQPLIRLLFRQRGSHPNADDPASVVPASHSAVLEFSDASQMTRLVNINNVRCRRIALMHEQISIGSDPHKSDIAISDMPRGTIVMQLSNQQVHFHCANLSLNVDGSDGTEFDDQSLRHNTIISIFTITFENPCCPVDSLLRFRIRPIIS